MSGTKTSITSIRGISAAATAAVIIMALTTCAYAGGTRVRVRCISLSPSVDSSMRATFEGRGDRAKFSASFEAAAGAGVAAGDVLAVTVDGVSVGSITVAPVGNKGDLGGNLGLDTTAGPGDKDSPFPADFPTVTAGSSVGVGNLSCNLMGR